MLGKGAQHWRCLSVFPLLAILCALVLASPAAAAITFEEGPNTVTTSKFEWNFGNSGGNPEWVEGLKWRDSGGTLGASIAAYGSGSCGDPGEFWGQSYGNADGQGPGTVVGGSRGTWTPRGGRTVEINATAPTNCSGDEPAVPVRTRYTFFDTGAAANMVRIERRWSFAADQEPYSVQGMRAYVPRLPTGTYNQEIWPRAAGTLATEGICNVCITTDWSATSPWIAINASSSNAGLLLLRDPGNSSAASITLDYDSASGSNNSGISLNRPTPDGWKAPLSEIEYLCFYDATSWPVAGRSATTLPAGCAPATVPVNTAFPTISAGAGTPEPGEQFTASPGSWENATGALAHQWSRCLGSSCEAIGGATGLTYTATGADVGRYLRITETATAPGGETDSAESNIAGSLSGHVQEGGEGLPANGAAVQACLVGGGPCRSTTTDSAGLYRIQAPVSGEYTVTGFPPPGSKALPRTRTTPTTVSDELETTGQDLLLDLPQLPPPNVGFSGAGVRGKTAEGVPVVHWQEPFVIEYTTDKTHTPEATITYPNGDETTVPPSGPPVPDPKDPEDGTFDFDFPPLYPQHGPVIVTIKDPPKDTVFPMYIDPSGFVRTTAGAPIAGATVTLYRSDSKVGPFAVVPDGAAAMSPMNRENPDTTDAGGHFGWDVIAGFYKVRAEAPGCHAPGAAGQPFAETGVQTIPPPVTDLDIRLDCTILLSSEPPLGRLRPSLTLGRGGTVKVQKSGAFTVKSAQIACPAASQAACTVDVGVTGTAPAPKKGKGKKAHRPKTLRLGSSTLTIAAGKTADLAGKLSAAGLRKLRAAKRIKATISVEARVPGGDTASGSLAANLVPPPKKKR